MTPPIKRPGPDATPEEWRAYRQEASAYLASIEPGPEDPLEAVSDYLAIAAEMGVNVKCPICHLRTHVNSPKYMANLTAARNRLRTSE